MVTVGREDGSTLAPDVHWWWHGLEPRLTGVGMTRHMTFFWIAGVMATLGLSASGSAQQIRSFTTPSRERDRQGDVPREYLPPRGMCRIWIDGVPPKQQPAPTDCATAVRNKPRNGRVIFGEDAADGDKQGKDGKEKPRKPEGDAAGR